MKQLIICLVLLGVFSALPRAHAFLSDRDPKNFFDLAQSSQLIAVGQLKSSQTPTNQQRYFLYNLKISEPIIGDKDLASVKVMDEPLAPGTPSVFPAEGEFLVFLVKVPAFTAYQELRKAGYDYRVLGGESGVISLSAATRSELLQWLRDFLQSDPTRRYSVLLKALKAEEPRLANDAAVTLSETGKLNLSSEDVATVVAAIRERPLPGAAKLALVQTLENSGNAISVAALKQLADDPPSAIKWAAIRSLDRLGVPRSLSQLVDDFRQADDPQKTQALGIIVRQKNPAAEEFLSGVLSGPYSVGVKRAAIDRMAESKTSGYEALLLKELQHGNEDAVKAEAILGLGRMGSSQAVPLVIPLLDSPSPPLRTAAFFMLTESTDPRAQELVSKRYVRDHHGVWSLEQNQGVKRTP